jgi:hypothetical protein
MAGYMERVNKAVEIAGGKVKRKGVKATVQSPTQIAEAMQAWVRATRGRGA